MYLSKFTTPEKLSSQELIFKQMTQYLSAAYLFPTEINAAIPQVSCLDSCFWDKTLTEAYFIPRELDIAVRKHPRYLPPVIHSHDFFEIVYVINGTVTNYINGYALSLSQGDVCIISSNTPHALAAFEDTCICYNLLIRTSSFEKTFIGNLPENDLLFDFFRKNLYDSPTLSYFLFPTGGDRRILSCFYDIYQEFSQKNAYSRYMLNSLVTTFFVKLLQHYSALAVLPSPVSHCMANHDISTILYYIQQHPGDTTLTQLSDFFHYSKRHISRILKEYTGLSFTPLIQQVRLNKAAELLHTTTLPISDIASEVGYNDCGFFYQLFHSAYGITPAEYRRKKQAS